jgi:hypothetical protein
LAFDDGPGASRSVQPDRATDPAARRDIAEMVSAADILKLNIWILIIAIVHIMTYA